MDTSQEFLNQQRLIGDPKADKLVEQIFNNKEQADFYMFLQMDSKSILKAEVSELKSFLVNIRPLPQWFDPERILKGQKFYRKYATPIMTLLGGLSLPYCYAASPGNKALYLSDKMRRSPGKRLVDTADFIIAVSTATNMEENTEFQIHINKLRLIHAVARYYILKSGNWSMEWGMPINQEDMAGTNLAFSYIILNGLTKSGYMITEREKENFLALWRYIGFQLYIDEELLPATIKEAEFLERTIRKRHFKKSEEGFTLTEELITYYKSMTKGMDSYLIESQIRYWLGALAADCVGLQANKLKDTIVQTINLFQESTNFYQVDSGSYTKMMRNHQLLKSQIANT
ncbi:MAG: DUF2236 domain-containing protein [Opitutaceae bacterium]|nr:DUF2236 domain-containing protein [Cytophagales bacterium]